MKFKRFLSLILTVLLVFSSIPMMTLSAETTADKTMIHLTDPGTRAGVFAKEVELTVGQTYMFTFRHNFEEGGFGFGSGSGVGVTLFAFNASGTISDTNRSTWRDGSYDPRCPIYTVEDSATGLVSFKFTVAKHEWDGHSLYPETGTTAKFALGFHYNTRQAATDLYVSDLAVYNVNDTEKTNLFAEDTGDFTGWHASMLEDTTKIGAVTGTTFETDVNHFKAEILPFDETKVSPPPSGIEEPAAPSRMLHFQPFTGNNADWEYGTAVLGQRFNVTAGSKYYISFNIATTAKDALAIKGMENGSRKYIDVSPKLIEEVNHGSYYWVTYQVTVPEDFAGEGNGLILGVSLPGGSDSYIFNMSVYDPYSDDKANKYSNSALETLDGFVYGQYIFWIPNYCNASKGGTINEEKTVWTYDYNGNTGLVEVIDYDASIINGFGASAIEEPAAPSRMLHFKPFTGNNVDWEYGDAQLGQLVGVTPGNTYYFSFGIATTLDVSQIALKALNNGNRDNANITYELVSVVDHPTYSWLTYSVTVPTTANSGLMFGISLPAGSESYIFNMNFYDPFTGEKTNKLGNKDLNTLDNFLYGQYIFWIPNYCYASKGGTLNEDKTVWTYDYNGNTGVVEVMDYSTENFGALKKMLYFKYKQDQYIQNRVSVEAGTTYNFSFDVTNSVTSVGITTTTGSNRNGIASNIQLVSVKDYGKFSSYKYSFTIPEDYTGESDSLNLAFVGIKFSAGDEGYLFNVKLAKADDATATQKMSNANFGSGLNGWSYGWDAWFMPWSTGQGYTEWSQDGVLKLKVSDYDESLWDNVVDPVMLHYSGTAGEGGSYIGQEVTLTKGQTYAISFNYKELAGALGEDYFVAIADNVDGRVGDIFFGKGATELTEVAADSAKGAKYTFTLAGDSIANKADTDSYTLIFGSTSTADVYIGDLAMYDVTDASKTVLSKGNYVKDVYGYYSTDAAAEAGATSFTSNGMTLDSCDYNRGYFSTEKTMLYMKEYKVKGYDAFVMKTKTLEPGVEYTVSFEYNVKGGNLDETSNLNSMFFGVYGGTAVPGQGQTFNSILCSNQSRVTPNAFASKVDTGYNLTYTFTLTEELIGGNDKFYVGFYTMPDPAIVTELYIANLTLYKTADAEKTNLCLSDEHETWVNNWYSYWGASLSGDNEFFSREPDGNVEYTAYYMPYDETLFKPYEAEEYIYGDSNDDGVVNILDLVNIKKKIANNTLFALADIDKNGVLDAADIVLLRKHIIGAQLIPVESNYEISLMDDFDLTGGADAEAADLKAEIDSLEDTVAADATGTVYYVAADGSASNSGTSEDAPINIEKVNELALNAGDAVVFKRGDTFRIAEKIVLQSNVAYGAYGTGARPEILGSLRDYADASIWSSSDNVIWTVNIDATDAANMVFNGGESVGFIKPSLDDVKTDGDYYFDVATKTVYLYLYHQNPGEYFDSIEIASTDFIFYCYGSMRNIKENVTVENITLKYATTLGMHFAFSDGFYISGCEIAWIGGANWGDTETRYGNGIQFWRYANNCIVDSNYIYQIFDAAISFQGSTDNDYTDLYFSANLIEYCSMNFEFWGTDSSDATDASADPDATMKNIYFGDNILRFGGYGWGGLQRTGIQDQAYILTWNYKYDASQISSVDITGNIFDIANCNYVYSTRMIDLISISGNTYYQNADSIHQVVRGQGIYATSEETFTNAITAIDAEAIVNWIAE